MRSSGGDSCGSEKEQEEGDGNEFVGEDKPWGEDLEDLDGSREFAGAADVLVIQDVDGKMERVAPAVGLAKGALEELEEPREPGAALAPASGGTLLQSSRSTAGPGAATAAAAVSSRRVDAAAAGVATLEQFAEVVRKLAVMRYTRIANATTAWQLLVEKHLLPCTGRHHNR
jgi:hypothetical protein